MSVKLVWITPEAEKIISYCARVSSPQNQENYATAGKLLAYCARNSHWSVFEMASMCLEIETTRAISAQIIRHKYLNFQEFSLRYAQATDYTLPLFRNQDYKNRQNSFDTVEPEVQQTFQQKSRDLIDKSFELYNEMVSAGIAKESARMVLPLSTNTRLYVSGTIRSWIHYIQLRTDPSTQLEHREIALQAKTILLDQCPALADFFTV